jgi:N-acetylglutamate synthase-like GNAT family acetyltransferase
MGGPLTLRRARIGEREALEALQTRASLEWEDQREALLANPDAVDLPIEQITGGFVEVAEQAGRVVGFLVVLPRADGQAELDGLFVEPGTWGAGIGRAMVERAAELARGLGASELHVIANPRAEGFYVRCDFEPAGWTETRFAPAQIMIRRL